MSNRYEVAISRNCKNNLTSNIFKQSPNFPLVSRRTKEIQAKQIDLNNQTGIVEDEEDNLVIPEPMQDTSSSGVPKKKR